MALPYLQSPVSGPLRQAEVLRDVVELRPAAISWGQGGAVTQVEWVAHPHEIAIVMTQACDLEQDYSARFSGDGDAPDAQTVEEDKNALQTIILCEARPSEEVASIASGYNAKRVLDNQHARYHCLEPGTPPASESMPALVLDLRKSFALPAAFLYGQIDSPTAVARRAGIIREVHSLNLLHRFYTYQSRVAVPTGEQEAEEQILLGAGDRETKDALVQLSTSAVNDHM